MEKIVFNDKTEMELAAPSALSRNTVYVGSYAEIGNLYAKLTDENLKNVSYSRNDIVAVTYENLTLNNKELKVVPDGEKIRVTFSLRQMTEEELKKTSIETAISYLSDEQAISVKELYPDFSTLIGQAVKTGTRFVYNSILYKTIQDNLLIQSQYMPGQGTGALYVALEDSSHAGTIDDPIPLPDNVTSSGFEYEYGKYYSENGNIYLCKRGGIDNPESMYGQKEILYYYPSALVGSYFELA